PRRVTTTGLIACVANFRPVKRHPDLVLAIARLRERGVLTRCVMVGDGPTIEEVRALVTRLQIRDHITFTGALSEEDVQRVLDGADVFALPSLMEGLPTSVIEAMAVGLPVVGSDVPGIREIVVDGVTGFLVPAGNATALAARLEQLLSDTSLRQAMGEAGRARAM